MDKYLYELKLKEIANEFDYVNKVENAKGKFWHESYGEDLELVANILHHRNKVAHESVRGGKNLLDIGCGFGDLLYLMKDKYLHLYGTDPSIDMVKQTINNLERNNINNFSQITQGIAQKLMFNDQFFNTILLVDTYEHIVPSERLDALKEIRRVLIQSCDFILITPSRKMIYFWTIFDNLLMRIFHNSLTPLFELTKKSYTEVFYNKKQVKKQLNEAGFSIKTFRRVSFYPAPERQGFLGLYLGRLKKSRFQVLYKTMKWTFTIMEKLQILNQKMFFHCIAD